MQGNRIVNVKRMIYDQVWRYEQAKIMKSKMSFRNTHVQTIICSQCQRKMRKDLGDIQIENKRENAPICMACILGKGRTPLDKIKSKYKPETEEKFKGYIKDYKKSYTIKYKKKK